MKLLDYHLVLPTKNTSFSLFPFACVHADNEGHSASKWRECLDEIKSTPNSLAIGLGDYMDFLRTHAREYMKHYPHDENSFNRLHDWRRKAADEFCEKYLDPIRDKLIGLSLGNHYHEFEAGYNDTMYMCQQLKVPYLGKGFFVRLNVSQPNRSTHASLLILGHHGEGIGGGATMGGDVNALENKAKGWDADVYLAAHNHKRHGFHVSPVSVPRRGKLKLIEKPKAFIRAGCFMRGYVEGCVTYAENKGLMNPTAIGHVRLDVKFKQDYDSELYYESKRKGAKNPSRVGPLYPVFKVTY